MDCVRCGGAMEKRPEGGVLLDHCRTCDAVWLDAGELEALEVGAAKNPDLLEAERTAETEREARRRVSVVGLCPRCQRALEPKDIHGVEVDQCRRCGGIFFDRRELPAVLARSREKLAPLRRRWRREGPGGE
jgi:Zn-finger nucleic acid-binding protein